MSRYDGDPRVVFNGDGSVTLPDPVDGDWRIYEDRDVWVAHNEDQGFLHSTINADFPATFRSCDEAIFVIVGDPQVAA
jgi:hypothetical protein